MPLFDLFWTILIIFLWVAWIVILFRVLADVFGSDSSGWAKAGWTILILAAPFLGVLIYLIAQGGNMAQRDATRAAAYEESRQSYIREAAGTSASTADELTKLADLRDRGVLSDEEFNTQKQALVG